MAQPQQPSLTEELGLVTGDKVNELRTLSNATWFVFNPAAVNTTAITTDPVGYVAFGKQYFGVGIDWDAVARWEATVDQLDTVMAGLVTGIQGAEDVRTLDAFFDAVTTLTTYLTTHTPLLRDWVENASVPDVGLGGTAVGVLVSTLDRYATALASWRDSLKTASGVPLAGAIDNARVLLRQFNHDVATSWADVQAQGLRGRIRQGIENAIAAVSSHLVNSGLVLGTPDYLFDDWDPAATQTIVTQADVDAFHARVDAAILSALASFPQGNLQSPATWAAINQAITALVTPLIDQVSAVARDRRTALGAGYTDLTTGLAPGSGTGGAGNGTGGEEPPPPGQVETPGGDPGGDAGKLAGDPNGSAGNPNTFAEDPDGFAGGPGAPGGGAGPGDNAAFAVVTSSDRGPGPGGAASPPPGAGFAGTTLSVVDDPFAPADAGSGPGGRSGSVIGGDASFVALGMLAAGGGRDDESENPNGRASGFDAAGGPLILPPGARIGANDDEEDEADERARANAAAAALAAIGGSAGTTPGAAGPAGMPTSSGTVGTPIPAGAAGTPVPSGAAGTAGPPGTVLTPTSVGATGTSVPSGTVGTPVPAGADESRLALGNAGRPLPVGLTGPGVPPGAAGLSGADATFASAPESRIGGGGQAGLPRPVQPIMMPASPASAYQSPGFWPPGTYGPSRAQLAGSPVGFGTAGAPGGPGRGGTRGLSFQDLLRNRQSPSRLAALYGNDLSGPPRRPEGRDDPHRSSGTRGPSTAAGLRRRQPDRGAESADDELDRGRVVPQGQDESWAPLPDGWAGGVIAPVDDHETPETYASVATVGLLFGAARRREDEDEDEDEDDSYRDKPRRGLTDGVIEGGE